LFLLLSYYFRLFFPPHFLFSFSFPTLRFATLLYAPKFLLRFVPTYRLRFYGLSFSPPAPPPLYIPSMSPDATLPSHLFPLHPLCRNPNLAKCGGEAQHLEKLGIWGPPGLPNVQSSTAGPKTPRIGVFFVSLERSWSVDP
jgi:hypothetical protein